MKNLNRFATVISLILVLAAVIFVYGGNSSNTNPSTVNTRGLGLAAYAELLRRNSLPVLIERSPVITLSKNDVLIIVHDNEKYQELIEQVQGDEEPDEISERPKSKIEQSVERHLNNGGRVLQLNMPTSKQSIKPTGDPQIISTFDGKETFSILVNEELYYSPPIETSDVAPILLVELNPIASLITNGKGITFEVSDSTFLRNRFISQADNAELGLWIAKRFLPNDGKLVFAEASVGNEESRTALDELGQWASTAFWQALLLLAVIVFTLNRRFGVASREITPARGVKELMGAMSLTLQRARRRDHALLILRSAAIDRVRKTYRLSAGMSEQEIISRMTPDAQAIMSQIIRLQGHEVNLKTALSAAQTLEDNLKAMEHEQKASSAPQ